PTASSSARFLVRRACTARSSGARTGRRSSALSSTARGEHRARATRSLRFQPSRRVIRAARNRQIAKPPRRPAREAQGGDMTPGLSRREFLAGASALGGVAIASAASAQITTLAPFEKLPPYGNNTLPMGVKPRLVPNVNGLTVNMLEA